MVPRCARAIKKHLGNRDITTRDHQGQRRQRHPRCLPQSAALLFDLQAAAVARGHIRGVSAQTRGPSAVPTNPWHRL